MPLQSTNPHNNKLIKNYKEDSPRQIETKLRGMQAGFKNWRQASFAQRAALLKAVAAELEKQKHELAKMMALEMGKPLAKGTIEVEKCAWVCKYYAQHGKQMLADELIETSYSKSFVTYNPLGTILAIMPWNYPFWQVFRCLAPNLMAGNTVILKHAANVSACAMAIKKIFEAAQAPSGVFDVLMVDYHAIDSVLEHAAIAAVTLTGSTKAGKAVAAKAGSLLKKSVMELGGADAYVVLKDADVEMAAKECVGSRLKNGGQSCISAKRFIVDKAIIGKFTDAMVENMKKVTMGNPLVGNFDLGPMARMDLRNSLHEQVLRSEMKGARIYWGGTVSEVNGAYYPCTILTDVTPGMPAFDEELFGPVAAIIEAKDEAHAIALANQSNFGLGGAVFTKNAKKGEKIAATMIEAGSVFVNIQVNSDPRLPFGGIKESGYGRELGVLGIKEFSNIKSVAVR
ncbi:MAG: NAD-dependent succinate-semialdehyde dehydrogenase [Chitinophagaceae bacterium]